MCLKIDKNIIFSKLPVECFIFCSFFFMDEIKDYQDIIKKIQQDYYKFHNRLTIHRVFPPPYYVIKCKECKTAYDPEKFKAEGYLSCPKCNKSQFSNEWKLRFTVDINGSMKYIEGSGNFIDVLMGIQVDDYLKILNNRKSFDINMYFEKYFLYSSFLFASIDTRFTSILLGPGNSLNFITWLGLVDENFQNEKICNFIFDDCIPSYLDMEGDINGYAMNTEQKDNNDITPKKMLIDV